MNIALPAIVVFFVFLPGVVARARFMLIGQELLLNSPISKKVIEVVLLSAICHVLWLSGSMIFFGEYLLIDPFLHLLGSDTAKQSGSIAAVADNIGWILFYFGTLIPACWVIPSVLRNLIISHCLDSNSFALSPYFRFNDAHWYYLLSGRDEKKIPELIFVSAIVQIETKAWIYEGILSDYRLRNDATLDYICLRGVKRRTIEEYDKSISGTPIQGHVFILRYSEIITLNIEYYDIEQDQSVKTNNSANANNNPNIETIEAA